MGSKYDQVVCDGREITYSAISYLHELGHTKIGYIGEQNNEIRYTAFKEALKSLNLPFLQKNTANVKLSHEGGYQGAYHLMEAKSDITAIFCANDNTAIGAIKAIREKGYRIPEDISIIGVDDIETAQYLSPMLTTVHIPTEEMGQLAAKILIDRINGTQNSFESNSALPHCQTGHLRKACTKRENLSANAPRVKKQQKAAGEKRHCSFLLFLSLIHI